MEKLKERIAQCIYSYDLDKKEAYKQNLQHNTHWQFDSLTNKNVQKYGKSFDEYEVIFSHIMNANSKNIARFAHLKEGDIAERVGGRWQAVANIYQPYSITRELRARRVKYSDRYYFKINPDCSEKIVDILLKNDFFYDTGDLTDQELQHLSRRVVERGGVREHEVPYSVLQLLPVQQYNGRYYHCYRSLPQQLGTQGVCRTTLKDDAFIYSQADLFDAMGLPMTEENVMNNIIC